MQIPHCSVCCGMAHSIVLAPAQGSRISKANIDSAVMLSDQNGFDCSLKVCL